jgi:hypothetical protein
MGFYCSWKDVTTDCSSLLELRRTDMGYCCSFNAAKISDFL